MGVFYPDRTSAIYSGALSVHAEAGCGYRISRGDRGSALLGRITADAAVDCVLRHALRSFQNRTMPDSITLTLVDGVRVVVPNSLNLLTPYVLIEQQDWFEDEIRFLRRVLEPGCKAIDIGANYGIYTLCMAKAVGAAGFVWAFEPASSTAALLSQGIAANDFDHVIVERSALSSESGAGFLALNDNSEVNALIGPKGGAQASERVSVVTLDECLQRYAWKDIDFLKIDAEGEEANILKGGRKFLAELSPLIQYEVKAGAALQLGLVRDFTELGYRSYRLVPRLGMLVPVDLRSAPDDYLLNLFSCKPGRAAQLAARGLLSDSEPSSLPVAVDVPDVQSLAAREEYSWRCTLTRLPYGALLATAWESATATEDGPAISDAMACYAVSRDDRLAPAERFKALEASFTSLASVCERCPDYLRLASLARVAADYGARAVAVKALQRLATAILQKSPIGLSEPFLVPAERFDSIAPGEAIGNWVLASALEQMERLIAYSSFNTGNSARQRLELIGSLGFGSPEMDRRLRLLQSRFGGTVKDGGKG
jgi:protein O-GlcNAc transferase